MFTHISVLFSSVNGHKVCLCGSDTVLICSRWINLRTHYSFIYSIV